VPAVVVGDASYQDEFKRSLRAPAPPNAVFTGYQFGPAHQQLTAHAGLFVLAAGVGGTHPVLVEQMAAGNASLHGRRPATAKSWMRRGCSGTRQKNLVNCYARCGPTPTAAGASASVRSNVPRRERYSWDEVTARYLELCIRSLP
jgi:hypothetical protein